jgi:hypothetical protein
VISVSVFEVRERLRRLAPFRKRERALLEAVGDGRIHEAQIPVWRDAWTQNPESTERLLNDLPLWAARPVDTVKSSEASLRWGRGGPTPRQLIFDMGFDPLEGYSWPPPRRR